MVSIIQKISSIRNLILFCLLTGISFSPVFSQERDETAYIGLGVGNLTFFGDVNNQNKGLHPTIGRPSFHLRYSSGITPFLDAGLEAMFGKVSANERGLVRNLNFESQIRSGGFFLAYNFNNFLKEDRFISPILSLGVSGFEFLSKGDLKDASGRTYYYWDDGTIRDLPQSEFAAETAQELVRDYTYESDLREANIDGFGDYNERAVAFPVGIGAQFKMGEYLNFDIHSRLYLTTTDYIDNVTSESLGNRAGDASNDKFFYTGFVVSYGLHKKTVKLDSDVLDAGWLAQVNDRTDEDKDGVIDLIDQCPHTPRDVKVDGLGCPIDSDKDGVPDFLDLEMNSAENAHVNADGETLDDAYFEDRLKRFLQGSSMNVIEGTVESASIPKPVFTPRPGKKYMVQLGDTEEGISEDLATLLLSIPDVQTLSKGDTVLYMVGDYDNLPDAVRRQLELEESGVKGQVVLSDEGELSSDESEARKIKKQLEASGESFENSPSQDVLWRVQVGAFRYPLSKNIFAALNDIITLQGDDDLTRYFSGVYERRTDAETYRKILQNSGFNDAFLVAFRGGQKISVREALGPMRSETSDELWQRPSPDAFDEDLIRYRVLLTKSDGSISPMKLEQFRELGKIDQYFENGYTYYMIGEFTSKDVAQERLDEYQGAGLESAVIVGSFNGRPVTIEEIEMMKEN